MIDFQEVVVVVINQVVVVVIGQVVVDLIKIKLDQKLKHQIKSKK